MNPTKSKYPNVVSGGWSEIYLRADGRRLDICSFDRVGSSVASILTRFKDWKIHNVHIKYTRGSQYPDPARHYLLLFYVVCRCWCALCWMNNHFHLKSLTRHYTRLFTVCSSLLLFNVSKYLPNYFPIWKFFCLFHVFIEFSSAASVVGREGGR